MTQFLTTIGFQLQLYFGLLICSVCKKAWDPSGALEHAKKHGSDVSGKEKKKAFDDLVEQYDIKNHVELRYPSPLQASLEGLAIHHNGYLCMKEGCGYACPLESSVKTHWRKDHRDSLHTPVQERYHYPVSIQSYFSTLKNKYWAVNEDLAHHPVDDLYSTYLRDFKPAFHTSMDFDPPSTIRDIPPWYNISRFHKYLDSFMLNKKKCTCLVNAAAHPSRTDLIYGKLNDWVFEYLVSIRDVGSSGNPYLLLKYLKTYQDGYDLQ